MNERQYRMIQAFADYERNDEPTMAGMRHNIVGMPLGTRLLRMVRKPGCWLLWLATSDYHLGTYLCVYDTGMVERITVRADEGDDILLVRPTDDEIRRKLNEQT